MFYIMCVFNYSDSNPYVNVSHTIYIIPNTKYNLQIEQHFCLLFVCLVVDSIFTVFVKEKVIFNSR